MHWLSFDQLRLPSQSLHNFLFDRAIVTSKMTSAFASFAPTIPPSNGTTTHSRGPSPNRGFSIPSKQALQFDGLTTQSQALWREQAKIDESKQIRLVKLSHMRYMHTDLKEITHFLRGSCIWLSPWTWLYTGGFVEQMNVRWKWKSNLEVNEGRILWLKAS